MVTVTGAPVTPEAAAESGFKIERQTYTLDGDPIDPAQVKQNTRFVVVLKITEAQPQFGRVIVADYLPAGFEIDNPHLVSSGDTGTLPWITDAADPVDTEFRDDRFTAAFERKSGDPAVFSVAYVVRAVAPGKYVRPQASVEDMYRPDRFGRTEQRKRRSRGGEMTRPVIARSKATKHPAARRLDCFAALAMTRNGTRASLVAC